MKNNKSMYAIITYVILSFSLFVGSTAEAKYPECNMLSFFVRVGLNYHLKRPILDEELVGKAGKNYLKMLDSQGVYFTKPEYDALVKKIEKKSEQYLDKYYAADCNLFKDLEDAASKGEKRYLKIVKNAVNLTPKKFKLKPQSDRFKTEKELEQYITKAIRNELIENKHVKDSLKANYINKKQFINNDSFKEQKTALVIKSFYRAYDPHSDYLTEPEANRFKESINGQMIGVGVSYSIDNLGVKILGIIKGSPADSTGQFEVNDHIVAVDGEKITANNVHDFSNKLAKPSGTKVTFEVLSSKNEKKTIIVTIGKIPESETKVSSSIKVIDGKKILVVRVPSFYYDEEKKSGTAHDFWLEYEKNSKEKIDYIVMDLRNNTGGLLDEAVALSGLFLGPKVIIYTKTQGMISASQSTVEEVKIKEPLVVMINKLSASASEIVAGALKDYNKAVIVGDESTYGKGTVQTIIAHPQSENLGMIKVTVAQFYLPKGSSTQVKGVTADIIVPGPLNSSKMNEGNNSYALEWDQIETPLKLTYMEKEDKKDIQEASDLSKKRINQNKDFGKEKSFEENKVDIVLDETLNITKDLLTMKAKHLKDDAEKK